ncbi:hypothetical protein TNCT_441501, partial [Trichonephila clavata]
MKGHDFSHGKNDNAEWSCCYELHRALVRSRSNNSISDVTEDFGYKDIRLMCRGSKSSTFIYSLRMSDPMCPPCSWTRIPNH